MKELIDQIVELRDNQVFPSKEEEDSIEHMDIGLSDLHNLLTDIIFALNKK